MTAVYLNHLLGMVTTVRDSILANYATDANARMDVPGDSREGWVVPLLSYEPDGKVFDNPRGALYFSQSIPVEKQLNVYDTRYQQGCGNARFELLPRMPRLPDEVTGLVPDIQPLVSISAGKSIIGTDRFTFVLPQMTGKEYIIPYRSLMPLAIDILARFAEEMKSLPEDLHACEDVRYLFRAA